MNALNKKYATFFHHELASKVLYNREEIFTRAKQFSPFDISYEPLDDKFGPNVNNDRDRPFTNCSQNDDKMIQTVSKNLRSINYNYNPTARRWNRYNTKCGLIYSENTSLICLVIAQSWINLI